MRIFNSSVVSAILLSTAAMTTNAFTPINIIKHTNTNINKNSARISSSSNSNSCIVLSSSSTSEEQQPCDMPSDMEEIDGTLKNSKALRNAIVTNVDGEQIALGDMLGLEKEKPMTSVVVFLRHMGWPYCWTYANEWQNVQQKLNDHNIVGPIFVSVGDSEKLNIFLDKNPLINRNNMFVDESTTFDAYDTVGFTKKFTDTSPEDAKAVNLKPPSLNFKQWMTYITSVGTLSPIPKDSIKLGGGVPEGVLRLGGTFVVKGDDIIYQWNDRLPGDHPNIDEILSIAVSS